MIVLCNNHLVSSSGPRVFVTRSPQQASALADRLRELGVEPVLLPTIEFVEPTSFAALDAALAHLAHFHWLLFTSANAVEAFARRCSTLTDPTQQGITVISTGARSAEWRDPRIAPPPMPGGSTVRSPERQHPRIAAIGPATARALGEVGLTPDLQPPQAVAESFAEALLPHARQPDGSPTRFLLVRVEEAREHLPDSLRSAGAEVTIAPAYRTVFPGSSVERIRELLAGPPVNAITFTSSSTARNLLTLLENAGCELPASVVRASIGPITSATLAELGIPAHIEAPQASVESLAEVLVKYLREQKTT